MFRFHLRCWLAIQVLRPANLPPNRTTSSHRTIRLLFCVIRRAFNILQLTMIHKPKLYVLSFILLLTLQTCPCRPSFAKPLTMHKCPCRTFLCTRPPKVALLFACVLVILPFPCFVMLFVEYGQLYTQSHLVSFNQAFAGEEKCSSSGLYST